MTTLKSTLDKRYIAINWILLKLFMVKEYFRSLFNALFPRNFTCDICGAEVFDNANLCEECKPKVQKNSGAVCPVCGRKTAVSEICLECKAQAPKFNKAVSPLVYSEGTATLIAKFKKGSGYLKEYFCDLMAESAKSLPEFDFITYVPITSSAEFKRGYNQSKLLAKGLSKRLNAKLEEGVLLKTRETDAQKTLSKRKREKNLQGCFRVHKRKECNGKRILLVDDVLTTGATADEICKLLKGAHAKKVYLITIASVEYKMNRTFELNENN